LTVPEVACCLSEAVSRLERGIVKRGERAEPRFGGDRFAFEPYVESADSATRAGSKLREIFEEATTVVGSERLQSIRKAVFADE